MTRYTVYATDGRVFTVAAFSREDAELRVVRMTYGRVTVSNIVRA